MIKFNDYLTRNKGKFIPIFNRDKISKNKLFGPVKTGKLISSDRFVISNSLTPDNTLPIEYREFTKREDYYNYIWFNSVEDYIHFVDTFNPIFTELRNNQSNSMIMKPISKDCFRLLYKK